MGSEKWLDFTSMDYSFYHQLNIHFISTNLAIVPGPLKLEVQQLFREKYNGDPSSFVYMGYDQFLFACELLNAFGEHFPEFISNKRFEYSNNRFQLSLAHHCYHNQFLQVFAFNELELVAVPMR
jgi:hypothetical protein